MGMCAQGGDIGNRARGALLGSGDVDITNWHARRAFVWQIQHPATRSRRAGAHEAAFDVQTVRIEGGEVTRGMPRDARLVLERVLF